MKKINDVSFNLLLNLQTRSQITIQGFYEANKFGFHILIHNYISFSKFCVELYSNLSITWFKIMIWDESETFNTKKMLNGSIT